ncbi:hypothetical protein MSG28_008943 [Choristoneura fumiferana]|uniref:Uncharacterized protein n=1 Tax=Choristoneura fumiferana TaxID=7141 RepID=A0ACC0J8K6_CHOFU|nr:hypothetical protein MSG28_008943 [Choristoneura fumiferana]
MGSTINLTCVVQHSPEPPPAIHWTHNEEVRRLVGEGFQVAGKNWMRVAEGRAQWRAVREAYV